MYMHIHFRLVISLFLDEFDIFTYFLVMEKPPLTSMINVTGNQRGACYLRQGIKDLQNFAIYL